MSSVNTYDPVTGNLLSTTPIPASAVINQTIITHLTTALTAIENIVQANPGGIVLTGAQTITVLKIIAGLIRLDLGLWQQSGLGQA